MRLIGNQLDKLGCAGLTCVGAEPRPQQFGEGVAGMPRAVGDVQGDFREVTGVDDAVGDELRVAGRQSRVVVGV